MRFGIISDTHGRLPAAVHEVFAGVDRILHAGDIGGDCIIAELEMIAPVTAVMGNNDYFGNYQSADLSVYQNFDGTRFYMAHKQEKVQEALRGRGNIPAGAYLPHICIHGHTHIPRQDIVGSALWLNPGSPVLPRGGCAPSVMLLEAKDGYPNKLELVLI